VSGSGVDPGGTERSEVTSSVPVPVPDEIPGGGPPPGIRTVATAALPGTTRLVLVRHGEAECNVSGVCGGEKGCTGLTARGLRQARSLRERLLRSGEVRGAGALYASVLPRAIETARTIAPALCGIDPDGAPVAPPELVEDRSLNELVPGEADGLTWEEFSARYGDPDWDADPSRPIAPGGESWTGFVGRAADALASVAARHPGQLVVVVCHAGVIEASMLAYLPIEAGRYGRRLQLHTLHTSLTTWDVWSGHWKLLGYNDAAHLAIPGLAPSPSSPRY